MSDDNAARNGGAAGSNGAAASHRRPLTSTERSRNSRARKRAEAAIARRRPPYGPEVVDPLGAAIVQELLDSDDCPEHVKMPRYRASLAAYGRAEAAVRLLAAHIAAMPGVEAALTSVSTAEETATYVKGNGTRRTVTRTVTEALGALDRAERRAASARSDLGLTPASAARMRLDVRPRFDSALMVAALLEGDEQRAAEAAEGEGTDG